MFDEQDNLPATTEEAGSLMMNMPAAPTSLAHIEQSRAIAEVQAQIVLAQANPRSESHAERRIMNACKRKGLAGAAVYRYRRAGTAVEGPSIRLAEVLARSWGNINYGFKEVSRGPGYSEVEAFCHDLETNTRVSRIFQVTHTRDKKDGNVELTAERDKYEMVASMAQRRVRACILEIIPGDIVESAVDACSATLVGAIGNVEERLEKMFRAFAELDPPVTKDDIEQYLQRSVKSITAVDIVALQRIYTSIRDGIAPKAEFFKPGKTGSGSNLADRFGASQPPVQEKEPPPEGKPQAAPQAQETSAKPSDQAKEPPKQTQKNQNAGKSQQQPPHQSPPAPGLPPEPPPPSDERPNRSTAARPAVIDKYRAEIDGKIAGASDKSAAVDLLDQFTVALQQDEQLNNDETNELISYIETRQSQLMS